MERIIRAKRELDQAESKADEARRELYAAVQEARAAGEKLEPLAEALGVTRQRITQIAKGKR